MTKKILIFVVSFMVTTIGLILTIYCWFIIKTNHYIYSDSDSLPTNEVGVVLGTSKYRKGGGINEFYKYRIEGAAYLYHKGKVKYLLLSGDNRQISYNEPIKMRQDLLKEGVPDENIILDYAGFRTLDSIIRANKVFDINQFTIITQKFHCERALFIAHHQNLKANCFAVTSPQNIINMQFREILARVNTVLDLYILNKQPKFLGPLLPITSN